MDEIVKVLEEFYAELYNSKMPHQKNLGLEEQLDITTEEFEKVLKYMKPNKASGNDNISTDMIKERGEILLITLKMHVYKIFGLDRPVIVFRFFFYLCSHPSCLLCSCYLRNSNVYYMITSLYIL